MRLRQQHGCSCAQPERIGVLAGILVARRFQRVEGESLMLKAHHRRGDRNAALALDRHPVRPRPPLVAPRLHFARQLNRPAKQQQFLGQGGLAGDRVRNDRKGAPECVLASARRPLSPPERRPPPPGLRLCHLCRAVSNRCPLFFPDLIGDPAKCYPELSCNGDYEFVALSGISRDGQQLLASGNNVVNVSHFARHSCGGSRLLTTPWRRRGPSPPTAFRCGSCPAEIVMTRRVEQALDWPCDRDSLHRKRANPQHPSSGALERRNHLVCRGSEASDIRNECGGRNHPCCDCMHLCCCRVQRRQRLSHHRIV